MDNQTRLLRVKLRPYQIAAVDALFAYWAANMGNPVVAMPTGTGKSLVIAEFCRRAIMQWPGTRILVVTHVKELVGQNFEKLLELWPTAPAGIYSAGLRRRDVGRNVTFCGIGSVAKNAALFGHVDLVLVDECHTISPKETTQYQQFFAALRQYNPLLKIAGLTATPYRLGQGEIVEPGGLFTDLCFDITSRDEFNKLIAEGYLCHLVPKQTRAMLDVSGVSTTGGDFNAKELAAAVDKEAITRAALEETIAYGEDRAHWLIFASGIDHTEHVAAMLCEMGIPAVAVHSKSGDAFRDEAVAMFKRGEVRALVNNGVFTTGFDFPGIDLIVVLRPTQSPGLWVQMLGRGTRPVWRPGFDLSTTAGRLSCIMSGPKRNCLVLDFAGNTPRLGPINDPRKPRAKGKGPKGDCPAKVCPACLSFNHVSARVCVDCGAAFEFKVKLERAAGEDALIAGFQQPEEPVCEWFNVESVTYSKHISWNGKRSNVFGRVPPSLRVSYACGIRSFTEHVRFEHDGHGKATARKWWLEVANLPDTATAPETVDAALAQTHILQTPARVRVWVNRKYPEILHREFQCLQLV